VSYQKTSEYTAGGPERRLDNLFGRGFIPALRARPEASRRFQPLRVRPSAANRLAHAEARD
jgi:hypothetical protein